MIRAILVLAWYTCAIPSPDKPCVEIETKAYSTNLEALRAYHRSVESADRHLYFIDAKSGAVKEYGWLSSMRTEDVPRDKDFDEILHEVSEEVDAKFCLKALEDRDQFLVKVMCKMDCPALANLTSDLEMTDRVREFVFAEFRKCRTARQNRAFNRLVCGKDKCE